MFPYGFINSSLLSAVGAVSCDLNFTATVLYIVPVLLVVSFVTACLWTNSNQYTASVRSEPLLSEPDASGGIGPVPSSDLTDEAVNILAPDFSELATNTPHDNGHFAQAIQKFAAESQVNKGMEPPFTLSTLHDAVNLGSMQNFTAQPDFGPMACAEPILSLKLANSALIRPLSWAESGHSFDSQVFNCARQQNCTQYSKSLSQPISEKADNIMSYSTIASSSTQARYSPEESENITVNQRTANVFPWDLSNLADRSWDDDVENDNVEFLSPQAATPSTGTRLATILKRRFSRIHNNCSVIYGPEPETGLSENQPVALWHPVKRQKLSNKNRRSESPRNVSEKHSACKKNNAFRSLVQESLKEVSSMRKYSTKGLLFTDLNQSTAGISEPLLSTGIRYSMQDFSAAENICTTAAHSTLISSNSQCSCLISHQFVYLAITISQLLLTNCASGLRNHSSRRRRTVNGRLLL